MPHDMIDEYFKIYTQCIEEYGERTCVFYACGSFYEVYKIENKNEVIGNADVIAEIIRCDFSNKNKSKRLLFGSTREFPDFCGFGIPYLPKYITPLLEHNYTVVIVDQLEASNEKKNRLVKRGIVAVHSPCLKSSDFETLDDADNYLLTITLEIIKSTFLYSICSINNTTNNIDITEKVIQFEPHTFNLVLDDMIKVLSRYNIKDKRIFVLDCNTEYYTKLSKYFLEQSVTENSNYRIEKVDTHSQRYKDYSRIDFQNEYFKRVYKHIDFGLIDPLERLDIADKHLSVLNLMFTFDFISKHDSKYINNLKIPNVMIESKNLSLELNTIQQLNILPNKNVFNAKSKIASVLEVIDYTCTAIGKRHLKTLLTKPMINCDDIRFRYTLSESLDLLDKQNFDTVYKLLSNIIDIDRLHRKMGLESLHPYEFYRLQFTYSDVCNLLEFVKRNNIMTRTLTEDDLKLFLEYIEDYTKTFDINKMRHIGLNTPKEEFVNFFNVGVIKELDKVQTDITNTETEIETLRQTYDKIVPTKLGFTDNDGYFFTCTKVRYQKLVQECKDTVFNYKQTSNMCKFSTDTLDGLSNKLTNTRELLMKRVRVNYIIRLQEFYNKYYNLFERLSNFIAVLDVAFSNIKCARKNNYCKPLLIQGESSFISAKQLRHPIIEIINNETEYIPNDIDLSEKKTGMLVYGLNSSGKSSLLRSLGISIILAQSGLYVPCKSFSFTPFHTLISQVDLSDNLFANKSSFTMEMCGLQRILSCSGKNTLVLSDELCRGTEINSSCAIVASTLSYLVKSDTKFFFTTHLHKLSDYIDTNDINICHLSVETKGDGNIIFERQLKPGSGSDLYGLEVCKSIVRNTEFIDFAFNIRNKILCCDTKPLRSNKSRYNRKKIVDSCQVCNYKPKPGEIPLDTHHINEQRACDSNGFVNGKHFHKNKLYNLAVLCKTCHKKIDTGELTIRGYKTSTSGVILDYDINDKTTLSNN